MPAITPVLPAAGFPPPRDTTLGTADGDAPADTDGDGDRDAEGDVEAPEPGSPARSAERRSSGVRPSTDARRSGCVNGYTMIAVSVTVTTPATATPIGPQ
ncbi:hypothetical protein GCM10009827_036550 [Dactylosporangium maewongense]|uniref:Uncharacterized protein n=1 Tax=Dactylosporangium maewongense TaxID=634393 RepID=A0ABN2AGG2_9ACTN